VPHAKTLLDKLSLTGTDGERARPWLVLAIVGALLFLPLLGRYGLWDPHEVRVAEIAREMAHDHSLTVPQRYPGRPALLLAAISIFRLPSSVVALPSRKSEITSGPRRTVSISSSSPAPMP